MEKNKLKIILGIAIAIAVVLSVLFGKEKIEQKDITITELKKQVEKYERENKTLSIALENTKKEKDIEVVIEKNADGSSKTTKKIKSKTETNKGSLDIAQSTEKGSKETTDSKQTIDKSLTITNPTKLQIGLGIDNRTKMSNFTNGNYHNILAPSLELEGRYKSSNNLEYKTYIGKGLTDSDWYVGASIKFILGL